MFGLLISEDGVENGRPMRLFHFFQFFGKTYPRIRATTVPTDTIILIVV
jgi:hypothetical protein